MLSSASYTDIAEKPRFSPTAAADDAHVKQEYQLSPQNRPVTSDRPDEVPSLRFSVGPHPQLPIRTVSYGDVSSENILAFGTSAVLQKKSTDDVKINPVLNGWLKELPKWPTSTKGKRKRSQLRSKDSEDKPPTSGAISTVYICDLDRPWRPFPIYELPGEVVLVKFSPCGGRLIVCDSAGVYYLLSSKHSALNAWHLLHKGQCPSGHKFIYATWTKVPQTFLYNPTQQWEGNYNLPGRPRILAISDSRHHLEHDGVAIVTNKGLLVVIYVEKRPVRNGDFVFPTYKGQIEERDGQGSNDFTVADTVYDPDESSFYLALASATTAEVVCVKFGLPLYSETRLEATTMSAKAVHIENSTLLTGKSICQRLKLIISSKVKYLLAATKSFENDSLELWELSSDLQRDFLDSLSDSAIVPAEKSAWSMIGNHVLPAIFVTWSLPSDRFITNDIDKSFTVSVAVRNGGVYFYTVKLGLEISIVQVGNVEVPRPIQYVRQAGNAVKRVPITPEAACLVTSANGCMVYMLDTGCRVWAFAIPHTLWLVNYIPDLLEVLLTVELDFCDVMAATRDAASTLRVLDDVYHGFSLQQKVKSHVRYSKLKAALLEKTEGKLAAVIVSESLFLDVFLTFLEQFVEAKNQDELTSPLIFEIPELQIVLRQEDATLAGACTVIEQHLVLDQTALRQLLTGFHLLIGEIVELIALFVANPHFISLKDNGLTPSPAMESLPKIRLILALIHAWTVSRPTLRQFWQRTPFGDASRTVMDILFEATTKMREPDWSTAVGIMLDENSLSSRNWSRDWKRLYVMAEARAGFLPDSEAGPTDQVEYEWHYSFLPSQNAMEEELFDANMLKATGEPDTDTFNLKPTTRKFCSRCFFNFPWRPVVASEHSSIGTWHSQMRYRWKRCFCGGAWIFL